jgi:hypothetical protein
MSIMRLYKCDDFNETKCKSYAECNCKYTFDPRHVWKSNVIIFDWVCNKHPIEVESAGCPANKSTCFLNFYKDIIKEEK